MFILEEKNYFWLLWGIPLVLLLFLAYRLWQKRTRQRFADPVLFSHLSPDRSSFKPVIKILLLLLGIFALIIALVNPKVGSKMETVKREGVDIVFAIDISKSMEAEDVPPNRLEKSKQLVRRIIGNLGSDRIGLIAYAGSAFPQLPITTDYAAAEMFLQALNTDMISSQGTAIQEAISLATNYYSDEQTSRVLFLISDGEDHQGNTEAIAEEAAQEEIRIFTIGVGTEKGGPIPEKRNGVVQNYKKDSQGETVITKLNRQTLENIARETGGSYIEGRITAEVTEQVMEALQEMERTEFEAKQFADFKSHFQWFLGLALLLLFLDILILERKTAWVRKLNLFNENKDKNV